MRARGRARRQKLRAGDHLLMDRGPGSSSNGCHGPRSRSSCSRRSPTSRTTTSAASTTRSRPSTTRSSCRTCTPTCSSSTSCSRRRGSCCTDRPVAARRSSRRRSRTRSPSASRRRPATRRHASYFLNIKGPELLNKYVGETERQIRLIFQRAREKSEEGVPVIVFFDEMDSLFRTRGTGISSDIESTIVPQLLAEIDGVESLKNVIVIGASNREDLIDPAILRPGRLDVKIKIERPDETARAQIFSQYLTVGVARSPTRRPASTAAPGRRHVMIDAAVDPHVRDRRREPLPRGHVPERRQRGPLLQGLLVGGDDREHRPARQEARDQASDRGRREGICTEDLLASITPGVPRARGPAEHDEPRRLGEDLGQEGRAHRVRPHAACPRATRPTGGRQIERVTTGQYLWGPPAPKGACPARQRESSPAATRRPGGEPIKAALGRPSGIGASACPSCTGVP